MKKISPTIFLLVAPFFVSAQALSAQGMLTSFLTFSNRVLIPFALAIAFLLFLINVMRFFVIHGADEKGHENARNLALYSVLAFVVLIIFWGVVNLLAGSLPFSGKTAPTPDYLERNDVELQSEVRNP